MGNNLLFPSILWHIWPWIVITTLQLKAPDVIGLQDVTLKLPEAVRRGEDVKLVCEYNLQGDALYAVKWFKGKDEFYRFVPKEAPPTKVFQLMGVNVDVSQSDKNAVVLHDVQMELSGKYTCEVSADLPLFHTDMSEAEMIVVDLPDDRPLVNVEKFEYSASEKLRANCTSIRSYPAANLSWFINDNLITKGPKNHIIEYPISVDPDYMDTARIGLELDLQESNFQGGKLILKCLAKIFSLYKKSTEVAVNEEKPRLASVLGTRESPKSGSSVFHGSPLSIFFSFCLLCFVNTR